MGVECTIYREAISARLDGETPPLPEQELESHLAQCVACRAWQRDAAELTRALRVRSVESIPDLTRSVLQAAAPLRRARQWPRVLLGCIGLAQIALGAAQAAGMGQHDPDMGGSMTGHLFNESTSWNLALGLGFLWAAWRMNASSGLLPVLSGFLAVLTGFSINDLAHGAVSVNRLATHGLLVLGLIALVIVRRDHTRQHPRPGKAQAAQHISQPRTTGKADRIDEPHSQYPGPAADRRAG
jgi:predicted anti-sigma-YlaC factor YlaD